MVVEVGYKYASSTDIGEARDDVKKFLRHFGTKRTEETGERSERK